MLRLISTALSWICRVGVLVAFCVLIVSVVTQVLGRSGVFVAPAWTEELTRFAMLWLIALGVGLSLKSGELVNVDLVSESLPGRLPWILRLVCALIVTVFSGVLIASAWQFTAIGAFQTSPALRMPMTWVHASVLVLLTLLCVFAALRVLGMLAGQTDGRPEGFTELDQ